MRRAIIYLIVWFVLCAGIAGTAIFLYIGANGPRPTGITNEKINTMQDPMQAPYSGNQVFMGGEDNQFHVVPQTTFKIWSIVVCQKRYWSGYAHDLSPIDLCVAWGKLAESENLQYFHCRHGYRICLPEYERGITLDVGSILNHYANLHVVPANENVSRAVNSIEKGDKIYMEGYLVNVYEKGRLRWESSLSRTDNTCEVFYVTKVQIGDKIYN